MRSLLGVANVKGVHAGRCIVNISDADEADKQVTSRSSEHQFITAQCHTKYALTT